MSNLAPVLQVELMISVLSGPDKGATYKLTSTRVTLGRAADNDIVIKDIRCSRHQGVIEMTSEGVFLNDISSHPGLDVDGTVSKRAVLKNGSHITLGSTILRFEIKSQLPTTQQTEVPQAQAPSQKAAAKKKNFYIMVGAVALILIWLLTSNTVLRRKGTDLRTESQMDEDIKTTQEKTKLIEQDLLKKGVETIEYKQMQGLFQQGFRDYREGNYGRALPAFDSVLALKPDHELARRYRDLAKRRLDELVQLTMLEGKRYMEQNKYQLALNAYQQVMILIGDSRSKQFIEAQEYFKECELLLKGAY